MDCKGCEFEALVAADQKFDGGEFSGSFDYGDFPEHTCAGDGETCEYGHPGCACFGGGHCTQELAADVDERS